jgi:hypothetical protein
VRKAATQNIAPDEQIDFAFWGVANQTLVGLRDRILVLQPGIASGAAFGCNAATLYYRDIVGVQAQTTMLKGSLEISTAGARTSIACTRGRLKRWQPYLDELRTRMASAKA